jgi:hypothetical protein
MNSAPNTETPRIGWRPARHFQINRSRPSGDGRMALIGSTNVVSLCKCVNIAALFSHRGCDASPNFG